MRELLQRPLAQSRIDQLTGNELNRVVAEVLGYVFEYEKIKHLLSGEVYEGYRIRDPGGRILYLVEPKMRTSIVPLDRLTEVIPDFAHDLNAAYPLLAGYRYTIKGNGGYSVLTVKFEVSGRSEKLVYGAFNENGHEMATVFCRARCELAARGITSLLDRVSSLVRQP